jgi:hypothetical protein
MRTEITGGTVQTEVYTTEGGYVAIRQPAQIDAADDQVCILSADQLPELIRELQNLYDHRKTWEEAAAE